MTANNINSDVNDIVTRILGSSELRANIEHSVRINVAANSNSPHSSPSHITTQSNSTANSVRQELHRLFPSIRGNTHVASTSQGETTTRHRRKRKREISSDVSYYKEVFLLKSPRSLAVLRGSNKCLAFEEGFAFSNVEFNTKWTYEEVVASIASLFQDKLDGKYFEILVPIGGRLTQPSLPPNVKLDGKCLKSVFVQKAVYARPIEELEDNICSDTAIDDASTCHTTTELLEDCDDLLFEQDMSIAVKNSMLEERHETLDSALKNLKSRINVDHVTKFNIYRQDIFNCCMRAINRKTFSPFHKVSVKYSDIEDNSEGAVDVGGPSREMFRLVIKYLENSRLFFGTSKKYLRLDMDALNKREYFGAGTLIAMSLIHGGQGPHFFSETLYSALCSDNIQEFLTIDDVEENIREKIMKIGEIEDIETLQDYVAHEALFEIAGFHILYKIEGKSRLTRDMIEFYAYHRIRPALDQFKEGLRTGDILELMRTHKSLKDVMCKSVSVTSDLLEHLFSVTYSPQGSSRRVTENRTITFWRDFIVDCEDNSIDTTLKDVLAFATGADSIPPAGFENSPSLTFSHDENLYPVANTCSLQLQLPTIHERYEQFRYHVAFGFNNCNDFAFA